MVICISTTKELIKSTDQFLTFTWDAVSCWTLLCLFLVLYVWPLVFEFSHFVSQSWWDGVRQQLFLLVLRTGELCLGPRRIKGWKKSVMDREQTFLSVQIKPWLFLLFLPQFIADFNINSYSCWLFEGKVCALKTWPFLLCIRLKRSKIYDVSYRP